MIDQYEIGTVRQATSGITTETALALIAHTLDRVTCQPANGAHLILGTPGADALTDCPILWFTTDGEPVIAFDETETGPSAPGAHEVWAVYHPATTIVGDDTYDARRAAIDAVRAALAERAGRAEA